MTRMLNDEEIKEQIVQTLVGTTYKLISFERNNEAMIHLLF